MDTVEFKDVVTEILNDAGEEVVKWFFWSVPDETDFPDTLLTEHGIDLSHIDRFGGEDWGSDYWSVYKFVRGGDAVYIKFHGYYTSYEGSTFERFFVVNPKEKTIIEWE